MEQDRVPFPCDSPNWPLVRDLLTELQERLLNETINAQDAALHIQVVYEACQAIQKLDERWIQRQHDTGSRSRQGAIPKMDASYLWFGMLRFLSKKAGNDERVTFLYTTLPNIIELALRVEEYMPSGHLCYSRQQKGGSTVLSRQFIASILACSFLCLFPDRARDRSSKLNIINFTSFFKQLPQSSQVSKLRCIVHYFERTVESGLERTGNITFHRQVADRSMLPSLDDLSQSETELCSMQVDTKGAIEDVGSSAIQVDFANQSIGGGVLGRGRVQEEIRFSTCPELIAAMLFMETMEDNEAIIISGFEQFAFCTGYAASLEFAGPFYDKAERDKSGNLLNTMCAIDAMSFRWGSRQLQYQESSLLREISKALVGFSRVEEQTVLMLPPPSQGEETSAWERDFVSAGKVDIQGAERAVLAAAAEQTAEVMSRSLLSQGMVRAVRVLTSQQREAKSAMEDIEGLQLDDVSPGSAGQSSSTPRVDSTQPPQPARDETVGHGYNGNGERLCLPVVRPQNGSCDLLEVDYSEWLANFRRRSSQLSDLNSRRSSSSTKHSSEFSSDLEEIYETLVQAEQGQHGIIEEETYASALSEYAAHFVDTLMEEGTSTAAQMLPGMKEFQQGEPPSGIPRPQVVRPTPVQLDRAEQNESSNLAAEYQLDIDTAGLAEDVSVSASLEREDLSPRLLALVDSIVDTGFQSGLAEAASVAQQACPESDDIPDDVYVWFADKIVQEVLAHVADELYFQRFNSDSWWHADLPVNRESIHRRNDSSGSDSASSISSYGGARRGSSDSQNIYLGRRSSCDLQQNFGDPQVSSTLLASRKENSDSQNSSRIGTESFDSGIKSLSETSSLAQSTKSTDQRTPRRNLSACRTLSQSSDSDMVESRERKDDRKSVTFTEDMERRRTGFSGDTYSDSAREIARASVSPITQDIPAGLRSPRSTVSHLFVVKDVPVPVRKGVGGRLVKTTIVKEPSSSRTVKQGSGLKSTKEASSSLTSGDLISADSAVRSTGNKWTNENDSSSSRKPTPSSLSFIATATTTSSIPKPPLQSTKMEISSQSPSSSSALVCKPPIQPHPNQHALTTTTTSSVLKMSIQTAPNVCDISDNKPADSSTTNFTATRDSPVKCSKQGAARFLSPLLQRRHSSSSEENASYGSTSSRASQSTFGAGQASGPSPAPATESGQSTSSEQGAAASLTAQDLNLDCYRAAAAIVNQVFQSLPEHLSPYELQNLRGSPSSFYCYGRKYESIVPRGSFETAAAVIGASEKGNVVSESSVADNKAVMAAASSSSDPTSPRRTRSQSPCFSWLSKRLSRETLTNAFVKVESRHTVKSYERRSSEPCQRSVTLSLQAFNSGIYGFGADGVADHRQGKNSDDSLDSVVVCRKPNRWRRGSLDSMSLSRRRSSCGFKDPVLSRFAQELMLADTSVPQLFLVGSPSTTSTTGSRRSSLSGFRDNTLATFESELLNSSFTLSQSTSVSPRHNNKHPKRSHSRESTRPWKSDSSEAEQWFPIPRRVGHEFEETMGRVHRHYSLDEIEDYADYIATTILQQAISIMYRHMERTAEGQDIAFFSDNLVDRVLRDAMQAAAKISTSTATAAASTSTSTTTTASANTLSSVGSVSSLKVRGSRLTGKPKSVSDSEMDFSVSSNDLTTRSLEDRLTDFQDTMDASNGSVEAYAGCLSDLILSCVYEEFGAKVLRLVPGGRPIATGNWGCGAFCGDPCLKVALQWVAASLAQSPQVLYFTYGDPRLHQLPEVVERLSQQHWTVGELMLAVRGYCVIVQDEIRAWGSGGGDAAAASALGGKGGAEGGDGFSPSLSLFDFLLMQL